MTDQNWFHPSPQEHSQDPSRADLDSLFVDAEEAPVDVDADVDLGDLFGTGDTSPAPASDDADVDLGDLFGEASPEAAAPSLGDLFDAPETARSEADGDLDGLFDGSEGEPSSDLGAIFGETPPAVTQDELGGLFGGEAPTEDPRDDLGSMFGEDPTAEESADELGGLFGGEAPTEEPSSSDDLGGLFGEDPAAVVEEAPEELIADSALVEAAPVADSAPADEVADDAQGGPAEEAEEAEEVSPALSMLAMGWATPPPAATRVGGLTPTHRESAKRSQEKAAPVDAAPPAEVTVEPIAAISPAEALGAAETISETPSVDAATDESPVAEDAAVAVVEDDSTDEATDEATDEVGTEDIPAKAASEVATEVTPDDTDAPAGVQDSETAETTPESNVDEVVNGDTDVPDTVEPELVDDEAGAEETSAVDSEDTLAEDAAPQEASDADGAALPPAAGESTSDEETREESVMAHEDTPDDVLDALSGDEELEAALEDADSAPVAQEAVPEERKSGLRFNLAERRRRAEEASMGGELSQQVLAYAQAAQVYAQPEHLWPYVDRVTGLVASDSTVQSVVNPFRLTRDAALDAYQRRALEHAVGPLLLESGIPLQNPRDINYIFNMVYDELIGISVLGPLWRDNSVTEILVDAWDHISIERNGAIVPVPLRFRDLTHAQRVARDLAASVSDRSLSPANPLLTAQLPGARITFAYGNSVVKSGISISLRKFVDLLGVEKLLEFGAINRDMVHFLQECVQARASILVSGGTGTGKTTQINALSQFIPKHERVITIEDAFELQLSNQNVLSLQTKEKASADDTIVITQADLLVNVLRMRPDRIVVGEIREGEGALVMLRSATTGHDGTMTTIHANSPSAAVNERLADLVQEASNMPDEVAKRAVAGAIQLVVQVTRKRGRRFISEIAVIDRSSYRDGEIHPEPVFTGELDAEGVPQFRHVGGVRAETELGMKLEDSGFDLTYWEPQE